MTSELLATVRRTMLDAAREHAILEAPGCVHQMMPPAALDAEERLVSALLTGSIRVEAIWPLRSRDFFGPLHRAIVRAFDTLDGRETTPAVIALALEAQGFAGDLVEAVIDLRDGVPHVVDLADCIARVREASRTRRLLAWIRKLDAELATGGISSDDAMERIRCVATKGKAQ